MNVLEKMVKNKRLPVLFIGSGIPKRYLKNFPSWDELLNESFSKVNSDPFYICRYKEKFNKKSKKIQKDLSSGSILWRSNKMPLLKLLQIHRRQEISILGNMAYF